MELLYYDGSTWETVWKPGDPFYSQEDLLNVGTLWTPNINQVVVATSGYSSTAVFLHEQEDFSEYTLLFEPSWGIYSIHGNNVNDFFYGGPLQLVGHYNGNTIKEFNEFTGSGYCLGVAQKGNIVIAVLNSNIYPYPVSVAKELRIE